MSQKRFSTKTPGVYYRQHPTRKHGVNLDKYYSIRQQVKGTRIEEGVGWASDGWTDKKVAALLAEIKSNILTGDGPRSLKEKRGLEEQRRNDERLKEELKVVKKANEAQLVFENMFQLYCVDNTHKVSLRDEESYFKCWLNPTIGHKRLDEITLLDLNMVKAAMLKAGKAPRSVEYIKAIVRQVYHFAAAHKLYKGDLPTKDFFKKQSTDNGRKRFLTHAEADRLLAELLKRSLNIYHISYLSLHTGMRLGEISKLRWQHVDLPNKSLVVAAPKNKEPRTLFLNSNVLALFDELPKRRPGDLVFPNAKGKRLQHIGVTFPRAVDALKLNDGITDSRWRVVFHTLRHTHASWLRKDARADSLLIAKALGHKTLAMTKRYTQIDDAEMREAMQAIVQPEPDNKS